MEGWESLRLDLLRLREDAPGASLASGKVVGLYVGPRYAMRVGFAVEAHQSRVMPLLIGTASMDLELGYAVPPGAWRLLVAVRTDEGHMWSAPLEITITP